jgi:hypothetical protein
MQVRLSKDTTVQQHTRQSRITNTFQAYLTIATYICTQPHRMHHLEQSDLHGCMQLGLESCTR